MTSLTPVRSVEQWAKELNEEWRKATDNAVRGFVDLGHNLIEAKASLPHGQWQIMVDEKLAFSSHVARAFMRIARWVNKNQNIDNIDVLSLLPPDYGTIDQITRLDSPTLGRLVADGTISPKLRRNEIKTLLNLEKVEADRKRIAGLRPRPGRYKTIVADPAWEYEAYSQQARASCGYARQSMDELRALDMKQWAEPNCHLWCWTTNAYVPKAIELVQHWGFKLEDILTWVKPHFGRGSYFRNSTEHCLLCSLGDISAKTSDLPSHFFAKRGEHSEKPDEFYDIVRAMCWEPYGEANQRKFRPDFTDLFMAGEPLKAAV